MWWKIKKKLRRYANLTLTCLDGVVFKTIAKVSLHDDKFAAAAH